MINPIVYLPVELKHRELDSRLMTASYLVEAGATVILGQQWAIFENCKFWPRGVILFKTVNDIQARNMANFHNHGHIVTATDEEVLTFMRDFCIAFSQRAADNCDVFFAQSQIHKASVVAQFPGLSDRIVVSGNPRIEMTSRTGRQAFQAEADKIRDEVGPFVLFNTNFATINSLWGEPLNVLGLLYGAGLLKEDDPKAPAIFKSWVEWEIKNRNDLTAILVWAIHNLRSHKIVVRPHPAERLEYWQQFAGDNQKLMIVPKSHHVPWIMASDLVIHTSCTTGLEAVLLDKPAMNIEAYPDPAGDRITSVVNPTFKSINDAVPAIARFLGTGDGPLADTEKYVAALEQYFPHFHEGGAAEAIARECLRLLEANGAAIGSPFDWTKVEGKYRKRDRNEREITKVAISKDEMKVHFQAIRQRLGMKRGANLSVLDESLFVFTPMA